MTSTTTEDEAGRAPAAAHRHGCVGMLAEGVFAERQQSLLGAPTAFGVKTAIEGFTRALFRHSLLEACDVYTPASTLELIRQQVAAMAGGPAAPAGRVWPLQALAPRLAAQAPLALHDPTGQLWRLHYLRSHVAPGSYPVTSLHHTVSYHQWLHQVGLPLLMARARPGDALICSSRPARSAIRSLLDQVRDAAAAEYDLYLSFPGRLEVIPLDVDTEQFQPRNSFAARALLGLPRDRLILLSLGRFSIHDKMDLCPFLLVFRQLRRATRRRVLLVLAGSDPHGYAAAVQSLVQQFALQEDVRIVTDLPPAMVPLLYAATDLFVSLPDNLQEMCGQTPLEAMAVGLPVVVSDWNGYQDSVLHGETGFRVPTTWSDCDADLCALSPLTPVLEDHLILSQAVAVDCARLLEFLQLLIGNDALRQRLGEQARRHVLAEYDWSVVIQRYEALWKELADQARSQPAEERRSLGFARPEYSRAFGHFATRMLTPQMRLRLTELGEQAVRNKERLWLYEPLEPYFDTGALRRTLAVLRAAARRRRSLDVGSLVTLLRERHGLPESPALRHLLWLLKYGLVSLSAEK